MVLNGTLVVIKEHSRGTLGYSSGNQAKDRGVPKDLHVDAVRVTLDRLREDVHTLVMVGVDCVRCAVVDDKKLDVEVVRRPQPCDSDRMAAPH